MASATLQPLIRHIHHLAGAPTADDAPDPHLLARFAACRDEAAFAVLVKRHGRWYFENRKVFNESASNRALFYPGLGEKDPRAQ